MLLSVLSSGLPSGGGALIWCCHLSCHWGYVLNWCCHLVLSSEMTRFPFHLFIENLIHSFKCVLIQCCGAGAARSRIIWSEPEPEPYRDAALAPTATDPTMVLNMVRNSKMTQNVTVYNLFSSYFQQYKSYRII
jgi:hypothetical protein